jgi:hypothetical protein
VSERATEPANARVRLARKAGSWKCAFDPKRRRCAHKGYLCFMTARWGNAVGQRSNCASSRPWSKASCLPLGGPWRSAPLQDDTPNDADASGNGFRPREYAAG